MNDPATNPALTGNVRSFLVSNTSSNLATNVAATAPTPMPSGTTIMTTCAGSLPPGGTCTVTITPGSTPTAAPGDTNPVPAAITVSGSNTNNVQVAISVLTYGSVYQGGYVFAVDDTTLSTGSISGKVAALTDSAAAYPNGIIWSSSGTPGATSYSSIPGITETSTSAAGCNGKTDGACNTAAIVTNYSSPATTPSINLSYYAAGLCKATINGFSDWYLPSLCEMGYSSGTCGTSSAPLLQNIQSSLVDSDVVTNISGYYWSSTELSFLPANIAWFQIFAQGGGSAQGDIDKSTPLGVRCARAITN
ncbi:hypothetical protein [Paraburkholderia xenovorans]|uniref:hypothetical protein n=1 Tax=Paraburkholderia xenovorans TaxID=36873 RepID=UPI0015C52FDD|nr:hypothetical protein [Paraburkholderia xenovorans]